jgi:hypothetical protein
MSEIIAGLAVPETAAVAEATRRTTTVERIIGSARPRSPEQASGTAR